VPERGLAPSVPVSGLAVFAYASLVDPASAALTLGRKVEVIPARLTGWLRRWSTARDNLAVEKTFARVDDGSLPRFCLGLNLEPDPGVDEGLNGVLIRVSEAELRRLDLRELRYDRFELSDSIEGMSAGIERVVAYRAKPEHLAPAPPPGAVILASYVESVEAAFAALGAEQLELYRSTTEPPPAPVVEGVLVADRIPPGNPRAW
jgi:cation transport regulator ChaC